MSGSRRVVLSPTTRTRATATRELLVSLAHRASDAADFPVHLVASRDGLAPVRERVSVVADLVTSLGPDPVATARERLGSDSRVSEAQLVGHSAAAVPLGLRVDAPHRVRPESRPVALLHRAYRAARVVDLRGPAVSRRKAQVYLMRRADAARGGLVRTTLRRVAKHL